MALRFSYERSVAPMLWALIALSLCELLLVHLLVALLWSRRIAAVLSAVTIGGIVWLVRAIRLFRRLPVELEGERLLLRVGTLRSITLARRQIARVRGEIDAAEAKRRDVLKLSLLAHPNVVLDLVAPVDAGRGRMVRAVAHRLDAPAAFVAALRKD